MQLIPLTDSPRQSFVTLLAGQRVTLRAWWQPLSAAWYLTVEHGDARLATSLQVVPWTRLMGAATGFDGDFLVLAAQGHDETPIGRNAWTMTHALWHLTDAELAEAGLS